MVNDEDEDVETGACGGADDVGAVTVDGIAAFSAVSGSGSGSVAVPDIGTDDDTANKDEDVDAAEQPGDADETGADEIGADIDIGFAVAVVVISAVIDIPAQSYLQVSTRVECRNR